MTKRMKAALALLMIVSLFLTLLSGCGRKQTIDPVTLVQGALEARYHNVYSDEYLSMTGKLEPNMRDEYEAFLQESADYFAEYYNLNMELCGEDFRNTIIEMYRTIYSKAAFQVGSVIQSADSYLVSVTVTPLDIVQQVMENDWEIFQEDWLEDYLKLMEKTEEEFEQEWAERIYELFEARLGSIGFMNPETITIQVAQQDGIYIISNTDYDRLDVLIIEY